MGKPPTMDEEWIMGIYPLAISHSYGSPGPFSSMIYLLK